MPTDLASNAACWRTRRRLSSTKPVPSFGVPIVVRGVFLSSTTPAGSTAAKPLNCSCATSTPVSTSFFRPNQLNLLL